MDRERERAAPGGPTVGVGIVGAGGISRAHVHAYQSFPGECRIVAVADVDADRARAAAGAIGEDVAAYGSPEELFARDDIQLVSICTPPFTHAELAIAAMRAGKEVLVEKPMAASLDEADRMIAAAKETGRILSVVFQYRWIPDWWRAKQLIDTGALGPIRLARAECLWWRGPKYYDVWWRGTWERECGGATMNHAIHHIDTFLWMLGEPVSVYAESFALTHEIEVEDLSLAIVHFRSGAIGQITSTTSDPLDLARMEFSGERAALTMPWRLTAVKERPDGFPERDDEAIERLERVAAGILMPEHTGHAAQVRDVLDAMREGRQPLVDGREGRRSLELITAIYKSAATGQRVELPLGKDDPFYTTEGMQKHAKRHRTRRKPA